jgi:transcriptional regulator with XRE-family HTH domain
VAVAMNKFAERLKDLRIENGYTRTALAEKLNISSRLVAYWENGQRECSFDMLITISELLNTSIDYLLGKTDY